MTATLVLLIIAAVIFVVEVVNSRSLIAAGLACTVLAFLATLV